MKLNNDIYVYEWSDPFVNNCNSYYIGGNVNALIDPGLSKYLPELLKKMKFDGIDTNRIRYIINTHSHPDHFEGSSFFNDTADIALHEQEKTFLEGKGAPLYGLFALKVPDVSITMALKEETLILGDKTFEIFHVPGHSPGSIALYWPDQKLLVSGDLFFNQNVGRTDFAGGDAVLLKKSILKLSDLEVSCVLPGHMNIIQGTDSVTRNFRIIIDRIFPFI